MRGFSKTASLWTQAKLLWQTVENSLIAEKEAEVYVVHPKAKCCFRLFMRVAGHFIQCTWLLNTSFAHCRCLFRESCWHSEPIACNTLIKIGRVNKYPSLFTKLSFFVDLDLCWSLLLLDVVFLDLQTCA